MARATLPPGKPFVWPAPPSGTEYGRHANRPWPHYDPEFVRTEIERYERDEAELYDVFCAVPNGVATEYRAGFMTTYFWFLGKCNSPILDEPGPPQTEEAYKAERRWAYMMTENSGRIVMGTPPEEVYGGFNPHYVTAVYRTLRWVTAFPDERDPRHDPMLFV